MHPFMHIGPRLNLKSAQGGEHDLRHLGRCGIVQIMQLRVSKAGKVSFQRGGIKCWLRESGLHFDRMSII
jgi:hypothetical protein